MPPWSRRSRRVIHNRLLQTTEEGGAQPKEYRAIYLADRVRNASTVWLAATVGCAQCHDHEFDPYLAEDFYSFEAFFADVKEKPVGRRQPDYMPDENERLRLEALEAEIERLAKETSENTPALEAAQERWEKTLAGKRAYAWTLLEPVEASSANGTGTSVSPMSTARWSGRSWPESYFGCGTIRR